MNSVATPEARPDVLKALRSLGGRGTVGDVVSSVGLPRDQVEGTLKTLLESHQGHLEVSESGELVYLFDRKLIRRDRVPTIQRLKRAAKRVLTGAFKAWIVTMLVVYFVVFVALGWLEERKAREKHSRAASQQVAWSYRKSAKAAQMAGGWLVTARHLYWERYSTTTE